MLALLCNLFRPFGIAFGLFVLVNLALAIENPRLSVTHIWLDAHLPEPGVSLLAALLGACLLVPHGFARGPRASWIVGGTILGFALLVAASASSFYRDLFQGRIATDLPVSLGAIVFIVLAGEFIRVTWWRPPETRVPAPARVFFKGLAVAAAFVAINLAYIVSYGHTDFRAPADAAVVLGAKVEADGRPCAALLDRLETGIETYEEGLVRYLVMSGGAGPNGQDEPLVMARYAVARGVPPERIILDREGWNTRASAENCRLLAEEWGFDSFLAVTQYFHCARVKLAFDRQAIPCRTVPTCSSRAPDAPQGARLSRETFFLLREAIAFPFYWLVHH